MSTQVYLISLLWGYPSCRQMHLLWMTTQSRSQPQTYTAFLGSFWWTHHIGRLQRGFKGEGLGGEGVGWEVWLYNWVPLNALRKVKLLLPLLIIIIIIIIITITKYILLLPRETFRRTAAASCSKQQSHGLARLYKYYHQSWTAGRFPFSPNFQFNQVKFKWKAGIYLSSVFQNKMVGIPSKVHHFSCCKMRRNVWFELRSHIISQWILMV